MRFLNYMFFSLIQWICFILNLLYYPMYLLGVFYKFGAVFILVVGIIIFFLFKENNMNDMFTTPQFVIISLVAATFMGFFNTMVVKSKAYVDQLDLWAKERKSRLSGKL